MIDESAFKDVHRCRSTSFFFKLKIKKIKILIISPGKMITVRVYF